jgi:RNA-directed DNA polymerase
MNMASQRALNQKGWATVDLDWEQIDWTRVKDEVNRLQSQITKAIIKGAKNLAKKLQYLLSISRNAKLLSVKKVTTNPGKKTSGVDGELWLTTKVKLLKAIQLTAKKYQTKPLRRVSIPKKNGKMRDLGIPTMDDRAMQALYALTLDPIAEIIADVTSFGFRKYRSCQDAGDYLFKLLGRKTSAEWVLEGDIKGCFDNIKHEWMLKNVSMNKRMLKKFLKAGYIEKGELYPTEEGTPQGGIISPILANLTLDGIEAMLKAKYWHNKVGTIDRQHNKKKVYLTRYADDFIITAIDRETLIEIKEMLINFLDERGLKLSEEKTLITHVKEGFDFLGWHFRKYNSGKLIIEPSKKSIKSICDKIRETIYKSIAMKSEELIKILNPIITGWCNYHKGMCSKESFKKIDKTVFESLWKWARKRHNNKSKEWIKEKYWYREKQRDWIFGTPELRLKFASDVKIIRHRLIKFEANPYLPEWKDYYTDRELKQKYDKLKAELEI